MHLTLLWLSLIPLTIVEYPPFYPPPQTSSLLSYIPYAIKSHQPLFLVYDSESICAILIKILKNGYLLFGSFPILY